MTRHVVCDASCHVSVVFSDSSRRFMYLYIFNVSNYSGHQRVGTHGKTIGGKTIGIGGQKETYRRKDVANKGIHSSFVICHLSKKGRYKGIHSSLTS